MFDFFFPFYLDRRSWLRGQTKPITIIIIVYTSCRAAYAYIYKCTRDGVPSSPAHKITCLSSARTGQRGLRSLRFYFDSIIPMSAEGVPLRLRRSITCSMFFFFLYSSMISLKKRRGRAHRFGRTVTDDVHDV